MGLKIPGRWREVSLLGWHAVDRHICADQPVRVIISAGFYGRLDLVYGLQDIAEVIKK